MRNITLDFILNEVMRCDDSVINRVSSIDETVRVGGHVPGSLLYEYAVAHDGDVVEENNSCTEDGTRMKRISGGSYLVHFRNEHSSVAGGVIPIIIQVFLTPHVDENKLVDELIYWLRLEYLKF